jgi:two-component system cell cycle sensor histidine kinase PleC
LVLVVAIGLLPLLALVAILLWRSASETEAQVVRERVTLARAAALVVDVFIMDNVAALEVLGQDPMALDDRDPAKVSSYLARIAERNPNWDGVGLIDGRGLNITISATAALRSVSVADRDYFRQATSTGRTAISQAVIGRFSGKPTVVIAVPVTLASGDRGVLTGILSLAFLDKELSALPGVGEIGVIVVDRAGRVIVHPDEAAVAGLADLSALPGVRSALGGETGSLRRVEGGDDLVIAYAPARSAQWGIVIRQPASAAFALIRTEIAAAAALAVVAALIAIGLAWRVGRRLQRYYDRAVAAQINAEAASAESERRRRSLEQLIAEREEFLAAIGHELKTPLTSISAAAGLITGDSAVGGDRARRYAELMQQQVARAVDLVSGFLDISRFDHSTPTRRDPIDLRALARATVEGQRALLPSEPRYELSFEGGDDQVPIEGDESRLEQVLLNLLSNAVKYSPAGGPIDVRVERSGRRAVLTVSDKGIGMTADELDLVFSPFTRGRSARERGIEGTGLGLHITKRIVEAHGGRITVASVPGHGTTVAVDLPLRVEVAETVSPAG